MILDERGREYTHTYIPDKVLPGFARTLPATISQHPNEKRTGSYRTNQRVSGGEFAECWRHSVTIRVHTNCTVLVRRFNCRALTSRA